MVDKFFNTFFKKNMDGDIDLLVDTIQAMLLKSAWTPDIDTQEFVSDIVGNEVSAGGYTRLTLGTKVTAVDNANDRSEFDSADLDWSAQTFTDARYMAFFKNTGADGTSALICYFDFGADFEGPLVKPNAEGWFSHGNV